MGLLILVRHAHSTANAAGILSGQRKGVSLTAHSSIIGNCVIGDRVSIGSYSNVFETNIDADTVVYRNKEGAIKLNLNSNNYAQQFFNVDLKTI